MLSALNTLKDKLCFRKVNFSTGNIAFRNILFYIIFPLIIALVIFLLVLTQSTIDMLRSEIDEVKSATYSASQNCESILRSVDHVATLSSNMPAVSDVVSDNGTYDAQQFSDEIRSITAAYSYINSIFIMDSENKTVYTDNSIYSYSVFFNEIYSYDQYNVYYWSRPLFYRAEIRRVLSPCYLTTDGTTTAVIPIVYKMRTDVPTKKYMVCNINMNNVFDRSFVNVSKNTKFYIHNRLTNEIFNTQGIDDENDIVFTEEFLNKLAENPNASFRFSLNIGTCLVSTYSTNNTLIGYTYLSVIPIKSIAAQVLKDKILYFILIIAACFFAFIVAYRNAVRISKPIIHIAKTFSKSDNIEKSNFLNQIMQYADSAASSKDLLEATLPYTQEKFLCSYLNSADHYISESLRNQLIKTLNFPNNYFAVAIISLNPTDALFDSFSPQEYIQIKDGFYNVIKSIFMEKFVCYVIPTDEDVLDIVLNLEDKSYDSLQDTISYIYELLANDLDCVSLYVGTSDVHCDLSGLKLAHNEAKNSFISHGESYLQDNVIIDESKRISIIFNHNDEKELQLALISLDTDRIKSVIDGIFEKNAPLSPRNTKRLYNYIINAVLRFVKTNNIDIHDNRLDHQIISDILNRPVNHISTELYKLIDTVISQGGSKKNNNADIIEYIEKNFCNPDLSVKMLADIFDASTSTVSAAVVKRTGMGVRDFINYLKIEKAKTMLLDTNNNIDKICEDCGFVSRQTFFRVFKNTVGETTGDYRAHHTNTDET